MEYPNYAPPGYTEAVAAQPTAISYAAPAPYVVPTGQQSVEFLIPIGQQPWLDSIGSFTLTQPNVLSTNLKANVQRRDGSHVEIQFHKDIYGCTSAYTVVSHEVPVARILPHGGCLGLGERSVECPVGCIIGTSYLQKRGWSKNAPIYYTCTLQNVPGYSHLNHAVREQCDCGSDGIVTNGLGRVVARVTGPGCNLCGDVMGVTFEPTATPLDKVVVMDLMLARLDFGYSNPCRILPFAVGMPMIVLFILLRILSAAA